MLNEERGWGGGVIDKKEYQPNKIRWEMFSEMKYLLVTRVALWEWGWFSLPFQFNSLNKHFVESLEPLWSSALVTQPLTLSTSSSSNYSLRIIK